MKFKPFSSKYDFSSTELIEDYPDYIAYPILQWLQNLIDGSDLGTKRYVSGNVTGLKDTFVNDLNVILRRSFSTDWGSFANEVLSDNELTSNILALMLQNYCDLRGAARLEYILANGGSAFAVEKTDKSASEYAEGVYDLVRRVSDTVRQASASALREDERIARAWGALYSRNPDYDKTVTECCDALEHLLRDRYEPDNVKPQLGMILKNLQAKPEKLSFKGSTLFDNKADLINLLSKATQIRGNHTAGTGRKPSAEEAEYVLHATIFVWNLHQGV